MKGIYLKIKKQIDIRTQGLYTTKFSEKLSRNIVLINSEKHTIKFDKDWIKNNQNDCLNLANHCCNNLESLTYVDNFNKI